MAKFKRKRTVRKERSAWVAYAQSLEEQVRVFADNSINHADQLIEAIEERNRWKERALQAESDFIIMEQRYRGE